jgi:orotate phosphoribosyltransferase
MIKKEIFDIASLTRIKSAIVDLGIRDAATCKPMISTTGRQLDWLIDLRPVFMQADVLKQIAEAFWSRYKNESSFQIGGMETAAIPLLTALLLFSPDERGKVNGFIIRKERKTTGLGNNIEGILTDDPILLVDDIINSGSSAEKARMTLEAVGRRVDAMFSVIDYKSTAGLAWRDRHDISLTSLFTLNDFNVASRKQTHSVTQDYKQLWHTAVPGGYPYYVVPKSAPLLLNERVYRGCDAGKMQAFDAVTGNLVWEYETTGASPNKGIWSSPAISEGRLYFGAYNGCIYCLNAEDGAEIWVQSYGEWVGASPLVVPEHGLVYFGLEYERPLAQGSIGAFDIRNGNKVWEYQTKSYQHGSPAYWRGGDLIIWGTADHDMIGVCARTGELRWTFKTRRSVKYSPAVDERRGLVAFASFDKSIYLLNAETGEQLGEWPTGEICYTTPLFVDDRLFCGSGDRHLYVIDVENRQLIRKIDLHARVYASPILIGDRVIVATTGGRVIEVDKVTLEIRGILQLPDAITNAIAASDDGRKIYVSTYMNSLYAFERLTDTKKVTPVKNAPARSRRDDDRRADPIPDSSLRNFKRVAAAVDIAAIREEIDQQPEAWLINTNRQRNIRVQQHTESIFLRSAKRLPDSLIAAEDTHESHATALAERFPLTMRWVEQFAQQHRRSLARVLIAKLKPLSQVYRHIDGGAYYQVRDRHHLVLVSDEGSPMLCGDESIVMREGEVWWFDNKQPHEAFNHFHKDRIHLIFDLDP